MSTTINLTVGSNANDDCGSTTFGLLNSTVDVVGKFVGSFITRIFYRFASATIPQNATIVSATFSAVAVDTDSTSTWSTKIHLNAADNPSAPADGTALDALALTTAFTAPTTSLNTTSGTRFNFDVASAVQEIVNRSGWSSGNALMIVWVDNGSSSGINRRWSDYSGGSTNQAKLDITYNDPVTGNKSNLVLLGVGG